VLVGVLWGLAGCIPPSTLLVNDEGNVSRCASYGTGGYGMETAASLHTSCVTDMKELGDVPLPPVRMGVNYALATSRVEKVEADSGAARVAVCTRPGVHGRGQCCLCSWTGFLPSVDRFF
jgi:hypothetical protein